LSRAEPERFAEVIIKAAAAAGAFADVRRADGAQRIK
jgi:hypothetical protein